MADLWQDVAAQALFWGFGFLGLFGITLLPWRSALLVHRSWAKLQATLVGRLFFVLLVLAAALAIAAAGICTYSVSRCLLGYHCNANRAGGWIFLAGVGFWYFAFELAAFLILLTARKLGRVAT